ncbi:hypothetical protein [Zobellia laminariae]|uniref:hypothetical protein n=1 Tax=Zobellia laminariae TaxID=248906 RepID=UPI0026F45F32|nr:hypothetical protein [Zobellia laminariae]WKX75541.1 hypothetical protein Q5W13_18120 [Zobellia laminariae]
MTLVALEPSMELVKFQENTINALQKEILGQISLNEIIAYYLQATLYILNANHY